MQIWCWDRLQYNEGYHINQTPTDDRMTFSSQLTTIRFHQPHPQRPFSRHLHQEKQQYRNWFSSSWSSSCFTSTWLSQRQGWTHDPALRTRGRSPSELRPQYGAQTGRQHPLESCENTLGPRGAPANRAAQARGGGPFAASPRNPDTPRPGLGFLSHSPSLSLSLYLFSLFSGGPGVTAHRTAQRFRQT